MSVTRLSYDKEAYRHKINNSVRDGLYRTDLPRVNCKQCYPYKKTTPIEVSPSEESFNINNLVDVSSELLGITRRATLNPAGKYQAGSISTNSVDLTPWRDQIIQEEESRTTHPACNLRGTGWDRWEWVCPNPQNNYEKPFKNLESNRLMAKDNHRPIIPEPLDQTCALPKPRELPNKVVNGVPRNFTQPKSVNWR